jgi:predicted MFS family arabinose efflux permease
MKSVTNEHRGAASSTNYIGMDLGNLAGPTIAGSIAQSMGYTFMWRVMTIPFALAMLMLVLFRRKIVHIEDSFSSGVS